MNLKIWNKRMLTLMDTVINNKIKGIESQADFNKSIGIATGAVFQVRNGKQSFTHAHILSACKKFGVSADWIYGFSDQMYRTGKDMSIQDLALELLVRVRK